MKYDAGWREGVRKGKWRKRLKQAEGEKRPNGKSRENWKRARNMFHNQTGIIRELILEMTEHQERE